MNESKTKSVAVYDLGLYVGLALKLAESYGKVFYYSPWASPFPKTNPRLIGSGFDTIERTNNFFDIIDDVDLFVFPDVYCGDIQVHLDKLGKRVWGSRKGEELELFRKESKEYMKKIGLDIGPYAVIIGLPALREYLKANDNQWVKVSVTRGDFETFHAKTYALVEPRLDQLEWLLGAQKNIMEFVVEEAIDDAVEVGSDTYCVDGVFPSRGICGIEMKDKGYLAVFKDVAEMPESITGVNNKLSETLRKYKYRNFISSELRVTPDGTPYVIDPCMRCGSPPSELYMNMFSNLAEIIWEGAGGVCIDPEPTAKFGIELMIHSQWAAENWQAVNFPEELRNNIVLKNFARIEDHYYVVPQHFGLPEVGSVIATGETMEEAIETVTKYAEQIESYDLTIFSDVIQDAQEQLAKLETQGIKVI